MFRGAMYAVDVETLMSNRVFELVNLQETEGYRSISTRELCKRIYIAAVLGNLDRGRIVDRDYHLSASVIGQLLTHPGLDQMGHPSFEKTSRADNRVPLCLLIRPTHVGAREFTRVIPGVVLAVLLLAPIGPINSKTFTPGSPNTRVNSNG
jgi:hypothetical protein